MVEVGQRKVLADFRRFIFFRLENVLTILKKCRSRGDGIEFKRFFIKVKRELEHMICQNSYEWLVRQGLLCSEQLETLKISAMKVNEKNTAEGGEMGESSENITNQADFKENDQNQMYY